MQSCTSAATSRRQVAGLFRSPVFKKLIAGKQFPLLVDYGGGRWDDTCNYLIDQDVAAFSYDPFNRTADHNHTVRLVASESGADVVTMANVLNVIDCPDARSEALRDAASMLSDRGTLLVTVYEGDRTGNGKYTRDGHQQNRRTADYVDEIQAALPLYTVRRQGTVITATPPEQLK